MAESRVIEGESTPYPEDTGLFPSFRGHLRIHGAF